MFFCKNELIPVKLGSAFGGYFSFSSGAFSPPSSHPPSSSTSVSASESQSPSLQPQSFALLAPSGRPGGGGLPPQATKCARR